jgi:hypothetical protein
VTGDGSEGFKKSMVVTTLPNNNNEEETRITSPQGGQKSLEISTSTSECSSLANHYRDRILASQYCRMD